MEYIVFVILFINRIFVIHLLSRDDDNPSNSDVQHGLDRRLRHTTLNTEQNQLAIKVSADN